MIEPLASRFHSEVRNGLRLGGRLHGGGHALLKNAIKLGARLLFAHARLQPAHDEHPPVITRFEQRRCCGLRCFTRLLFRGPRRPVRLHSRLGVKGQPDLDGSSGLDAVKFRRAHADNRNRDAIDGDRPPQDGGVAPEAPLPIAVTDHGCHWAGSDSIVVGSEGAAEYRLNAQGGKERSGDELSLSPARFSVVANVQFALVTRQRHHT